MRVCSFVLFFLFFPRLLSLDFPSDVEQVGQILGRELLPESSTRTSAGLPPPCPAALEKEFKQAKCCLLSSSAAVVEAFGSGTFTRTETLDTSSGEKTETTETTSEECSAFNLANTLERPVKAAIEEDFDLIFIHTTATAGSDPLAALDEAAKVLLDKCVDDTTMLVLLLGEGQSQRSPPAGQLVQSQATKDQKKNDENASCGDEKEEECSSTSGAQGNVVGNVLPYTPKQSYQFTDGEMIEDWCDKGLVLSVHYSPLNHVRKDLTQRLSFSEAFRRGGNGVTLAIHFLKSVMYNLLKAPKYGS